MITKYLGQFRTLHTILIRIPRENIKQTRVLIRHQGSENYLAITHNLLFKVKENLPVALQISLADLF